MPRSYPHIYPGLLLPEYADTLNEALRDIGSLIDNIRATAPLWSVQDYGGVVIGLDLQSDPSQMSVPPGGTVTNYGTLVFTSGSTLTINSGGTINFNAGSIVNFYAATYTFQSNVTFLYASSSTTVTFAGWVIAQDLVACSDWWYCYTSLTWNTDKTDYSQGTNSALWFVNVTGAVNLTGIVPRTSVGTISQQINLIVVKESSNAITVKHDATSAAANRIYTPGGVDYVVKPGDTLVLQYDPTADSSVGRWRVVVPMGNVSNGGTGVTTLTAYELVFGGTTSTGPVQQTGLGTAGQVLTSNGAGAVATFQNSVAGSIVVQTDTTGNTATTNILSAGTMGYAGFLVFSLTAYITVTAITGTLVLSVTWTDENNTSQTFTIKPVDGSAITATGGYLFPAFVLRAHATSTITLTATLSAGTATFDCGGNLSYIR